VTEHNKALKLEKRLTEAFQFGRLAGASGWSMESCNYRSADARARWMQGWHKGRLEKESRDRNSEPLSETAKTEIAKIRKLLENKSKP
jgi:ribosome modulation factor